MTTDARPSERRAAVEDALPLRPGMRVLEIGGAPGAAASPWPDASGTDTSW